MYAIRKRHQPGDVVNLPPFLAARNLILFVSSELVTASTPLAFQAPSRGPVAHGHRAEILLQVCEVYLKARDAGVLLPAQRHIAERAEILIRGLATIGIIALVDEATGYQRIREERSLATILEKFITKELQPCKKDLPLRVLRADFPPQGVAGLNGVKRPSVIGKYTNDIVYARVAPGVLDELRRLNPSAPNGIRKWRHHQWFTPEPGYIKLNQYLAAVIALMKAANSWDQFHRSLKRAFPQLRDQLDFDFGDGE